MLDAEGLQNVLDALSLISLSIAPYFLILSINALAKSLSDDPHGVTDLYSDFLHTKNCAAVDPLSIAGVLLYRVSVATSSFLGCMLRIGLVTGGGFSS